MTESCADDGMPDAAEPLLAALDFKALGDKGHKKYNVLRIHGPNIVPVGRDTDMIPIQVWGFDPTLDGEELNLRKVIHITKVINVKVKEGSMLDFLIIVDENKF